MTNTEIGTCVCFLGFSAGVVFWIWVCDIIFGRRR